MRTEWPRKIHHEVGVQLGNKYFLQEVNMKKLFIVASLTLVLTLLITACSTSPSSSVSPSKPASVVPPAQSVAPPASSTAASSAQAAPSSKPAATPPTSQTSGPTPQYGGILKVISRQAPTIFGYPPETDPISASIGRIAIEGLLWNDDAGSPTPRLATSWEVAPDGKSISFFLRKGVKFHDGTDFNADSVKWNFDTYMTVKPIPPVTSIDVIDPYTVRLNLSQFSNVLYNTLAFQGIISPAAVQKNGKEWARTNPVATGPFKFTSFQRDVSVKYEKFADYWDKGKPYLDGIEYSFVADPMTASLAFQNGQSHMISQLTPKDGNELKNKGFNVVYLPGMIFFLAPDSANKDSPYAKQNVREALEYAIDAKAIVNAIGYGFVQATNQLSPSKFVGYNSNIQGRSYNPAKAKQLLADAGYANGFKTSLIARTTDLKDTLVAVQNYLKDVGIDAALEINEPSKYELLRTKGWNGLLIGSTGADPNQNQRLSADLAVNSGYYFSVARPADWQATLDKSMAAKDINTRKGLMEQLLKIAADNALVSPLYVYPDMGAEVKNLNCDYLMVHHVQWKPGEAWLSK
jgi:peptide/nickel transport system substrate-binding protein